MTLTNRYWPQGTIMVNLLKVAIAVIGFVMCIMALSHATQYKIQKLSALKGADVTFVTAADRERQLTCLARNIYYEAGYEPFEGKVAVAQVTLNRAVSGDFPSDICGVVYQKNKFVDRVVCQFSWYCEQPGKLKPINASAYNESMEVAKKVLLEGFKLDGLKEALYYHADYVNPRWGKEKIAVIGRHIFYSGKKAGT